VSRGGTQVIAAAPGITRRRTLPVTRSLEMRGEILACAVGFGLLAFLMCAGHVRSGGFYYDDWSLVALGRFPGAGGLLHSLWLDYGQRPGQVLYYAALDEAFGAAAGPRLALAAAMVVLQATCLYALLRCLAMRARDAAVIAALALTFPFSDSVWLWGVLSLTSLAISAALLGMILALRALQRTGRRAFALHAASLALYVASILSYEAFAVAGCLAGLLYAQVVGLRRARPRWALDVLVIGVTLAFARLALPIDVATPSRTQSLAGMVHHAGLILTRGARLLGAAALPVTGASPWIGTSAIAAVLVAAAAICVRMPSGDGARPELRRWLALAGVGAVAALAAWAVYLPASDHYAPTAAGTVNRVNAAAAIGIAVLLYSCIVLGARMLVRLTRLPASGGALVVGAAALALGSGYVARSLADARAWDAAAADQRTVLAGMHAALVRLAGDATVYVYGAPASVGPGIPVLNTTLDLSSAMRVSYSSPRLRGVPTPASASVRCGPRGPLAAGVSGAYGDSYLLDLPARRALPLLGRAQCAAQAQLEGVAAPPPRSACSASTGSNGTSAALGTRSVRFTGCPPRRANAARMTIPWQTTSAGSSSRSTSASAALTRTSCSAKDSPPGNAKPGSPAANAANCSGACAMISAKLRSVQSPASVSIRRASSRGSSPSRRATTSAVSRARRSGLHHSSANPYASARSARSAACSRPVSSSGTGSWP
jgi:hypothetical protein